MLLGDSDGNRYTPFIIFKVKPSKDSAFQQENDSSRYGFGVQNWKDVRNIRAETELEVFGNSKGWWNEKLSIAFLKFHFASRVPQDYVLLLWDDFSGHWTASVRKYAAEITLSSSKFLLTPRPSHSLQTSRGTFH
ncbi:Source PGD [Phytophthora oleae]|uniref:Source PGD n=1 Tax=Phytophthora oleae TaxID=2107226 RepID=A0ABD3ERM5_9STRA